MPIFKLVLVWNHCWNQLHWIYSTLNMANTQWGQNPFLSPLGPDQLRSHIHASLLAPRRCPLSSQPRLFSRILLCPSPRRNGLQEKATFRWEVPCPTRRDCVQHEPGVPLFRRTGVQTDAAQARVSIVSLGNRHSETVLMQQRLWASTSSPILYLITHNCRAYLGLFLMTIFTYWQLKSYFLKVPLFLFLQETIWVRGEKGWLEMPKKIDNYETEFLKQLYLYHVNSIFYPLFW